MLETMLERLTPALAPQSSLGTETMMTPIIGTGMEIGAATSLAQMAMAVPGTTTQAPLIMGGEQPEVCVYVGLN